MARFSVGERDGGYRITAENKDMCIGVEARVASRLPADSVFSSMEEASKFFRGAPAGYSDTRVPGVFDGVRMEATYRAVRPLAVDSVTSSFFDDRRLFPRGTITVDSAFAVSGLATWRPSAPLVAASGHVAPAGRP